MVDGTTQRFQKTMVTEAKKPNVERTEKLSPDDVKYRERVFQIVRRIPSGRVMTYGQIAALLDENYTARTVGFVMHASPEDVPWQRVINSQGACSTSKIILPPDLQQRLLESEDVKFDAKGRCDLNVYRWTPEEVADESAKKENQQASLFND